MLKIGDKVKFGNGEGTLGRDVDLFVDDILQAGLRLNEKFGKDYRH